MIFLAEAGHSQGSCCLVINGRKPQKFCNAKNGIFRVKKGIGIYVTTTVSVRMSRR